MTEDHMTEDARLKDFEACKAALDKLGVKYNLAYEYRGAVGPERKRYDLPLFDNVELPFTADTWVSLTRNDGQHYIGGCCGSSGGMQDMVCSWYRAAESWVPIRDLAELADGQIEHDGDASPFHHAQGNLFESIAAQPERWGDCPPGKTLADPWGAMAVIWHLTKNHYSQREPAAAGDHLSPLVKSLRIVEHTCRAISWERLFSERGPDGKPVPKVPTAQEKVDRAIGLARFLPAMKMLYEHARDLYHGPVSGYAIIEREKGPKAIAENGLGYCIYETEVEVAEIFDRWDENAAEFKERRETRPSRERFDVRPVTVDLENGIVFTDTGEKYEGKNT